MYNIIGILLGENVYRGFMVRLYIEVGLNRGEYIFKELFME